MYCGFIINCKHWIFLFTIIRKLCISHLIISFGYQCPMHSLKNRAALIMTLTSFSTFPSGWLSSYMFIFTVLPFA